jgi:cytochrome c oxidase subunit II
MSFGTSRRDNEKADRQRRQQGVRSLWIIVPIIVVLSGILAYVFLRVDFIPDAGSTERGLIDNFLKLLLAIAGTIFILILGFISYSVIFFRRRKGDNTDAIPVRGNTKLEIVWTVIPLIIVTILGVYGARVLDIMTGPNYEPSQQTVFSLGALVPGAIPVSSGNATQNELIVNVTASRFAWKFDYPDYGITSYTLEVPVNQRIRFNIRSLDVVHSFWVQEWGPKQDAVPGLSPVLRITPTKIGNFLVQCSQLCGPGHTSMTAPVSVVSAADFEAWVKQQQTTATPTPPPSGHTAVDLTAKNIAFNLQTITVTAGSEVMINFNNQDQGIPHNFAVYTDSTASKAIFVGQIITGPNTTTYTFTAPTKPGSYFFRCDVHPTMMTGIFVVQ